MFVFYRVVNDWLPQQENVVQIVAAATIAVAPVSYTHLTIECSRSVHSIVLRMARVNGNMSSAALQLSLIHI